MNSAQWRTAWRIYQEMRELPPHEQRPFAESQSADPEVLAQALQLLEASPEGEDSDLDGDSCYMGMEIGRYLVGELLGRGGMGEVYAARDQELDRPVALKFLPPDQIGDQSAMKRILGEARAASALNHPNILTVYETIQTPSGLAIAMEMVEGRALSEFRGDTLPLQQAVDVIRQVAFALVAAHAGGIVHRDIKPENLMLRPDGLVKVLDFGLAYRPGGQAVPGRTISAMPGGTLRYMSPEQLRDEVATGASDIFSLGLVFYEFVAGRHPFESTDAWETAYAIHTRKPDSPSKANPAVPAWLDRVILSMLAPDPAARPTARDLLEQLARRLQPAMLTAFRKRRYRILTAAILAAAVAGALELRWKTPSNAEVHARGPVPLTGMDGLELFPAFSPNGRQVVYSRDTGSGQSDLYLKRVGGGLPVRLAAAESGNVDPAWSPDGTRIAFLRPYADHVGVFIMSASGGPERLAGNVSQPRRAERALTWRPDQKALVVSDVTKGPSIGLSLLPLDGSARQWLTSPPDKSGDIAPAYSPDGRILAFIRMTGHKGELFVMEKPGHERRIVTSLNVVSLAWSASGRSILFTTAGPYNRACWRISPSGGSPVQVPEFAGSSPFNVTTARHGDLVAFANIIPATAEVLKLDATGGSAPQPIIASAGFNTDPSFSPDGTRIAFSTTRVGAGQIWITGKDGSNPVAVTSVQGGQCGSPRWSPDGRQLAFDRVLEAGSGVFTINADGGTPREVAADASLPEWSADGRWIYFASSRSGSAQIWRVPSSGGEPIPVTRHGGMECFPSADGRFLYYTKAADVPGIWQAPVEGGSEIAIPELRPVVRYRYWSGTSAGIVFYDPGTNAEASSLKLYHFSHRRVERILSPVPPPMDLSRGLAVSTDGRQILWVRVTRRVSQILLMDGFQ